MRHLLLVAAEKTGVLTPNSCRRAGCFVSLVAERPIPGCENPDRFIRVDDLLNTDHVLEVVAAQHARHPIGAALARDEYAVEPTTFLTSSLGLRGLAPAAALAARDKLFMRRRLAAAGVSVPLWRAARSCDDALVAAHELQFPVVLKPRRLSGAIGVIRVTNAAELREAWAVVQAVTAQQPRHAGMAADTVLVETFIDGLEYSVEMLAVNGSVFPLAVVDKPDPMLGPFFDQRLFITPSSSAMSLQVELVETAIAAMKAVGIDQGPCHVELRHPTSGGTPIVIELGARTGGSRDILLRLSKGIDLTRLTVDAAFGSVPSELPHWSEAISYCAIRGISINEAGTVLSIQGVETARQVPLIDSINLRVRPGSVVFPYPYTNPKIGPIIGNGSDYTAVRSAVDRAHDLIAIQIGEAET